MKSALHQYSVIISLFLLLINISHLQAKSNNPNFTLEKTFSSQKTIHLHFQLDKFDTVQIQQGDTNFTSIILIGSQFTGEPGLPALPSIIRLIAIPDEVRIDQIGIHCNVIRSERYNNFLLAPIPTLELQSDSVQITKELLKINEAGYQNSNFFPDKPALLRRDGYLRDLRIAYLEIYPFRYLAAERKLEVIHEMEIQIKFPATFPLLAKSSTIFNQVINQQILNGEFFVQNILNTPTHQTGNVFYPQNLQSSDNQADYIIIVPHALVNCSALRQFARYRADYNGFAVSVVDLDLIYSQFPNYLNDRSIRSFLLYAWDNWQAPGMGDNHPGYLLLIGDGLRTDPYYLPLYDAGRPYLSDHYYGCMNDQLDFDNKSTLIADLMVGRWSVDSESDLQIITNKTIEYEQRLPEDYPYKKKIGLFCGFPNDQGLYNVVEQLFGNQNYFQLSEVEYYSSQSKQSFKNKLIETLNEGRQLITMSTHGYYQFWLGSSSATKHFHLSDTVSLKEDNHSIILSMSCSTGELLHEDTDCLAEIFLKYPKGGSVGFFGANAPSHYSENYVFTCLFFDLLLQQDLFDIGSLIFWGKVLSSCTRDEYLYFGDPAVSLKPEPNTGFADLVPLDDCPIISWHDTTYNKATLSLRIANQGLSSTQTTVLRVYKDTVSTHYKIGADILIPALEARYDTTGIQFYLDCPYDTFQMLILVINADSSALEKNYQNNRLQFKFCKPLFFKTSNLLNTSGLDFQNAKIFSCDLDGDSDNDIMITEIAGSYPEIYIYENINGIFNQKNVLACKGEITPQILDLNGDYLSDIISIEQHSIFVHKNLGNMQFETHKDEIDLNGKHLLQLILWDYDKNGQIDFLASCQEYPYVLLLENNDDFHFTLIFDYLNFDLLYRPKDILIFDYNQDGWDDLLINENKIRLFENQRLKNWVEVTDQILPPGATSYSLYDMLLVDHNNDGRLDILTQSSKGFNFWIAQPDNRFVEYDSDLGIFSYGYAFPFDFDHNNKLDLFIKHNSSVMTQSKYKLIYTDQNNEFKKYPEYLHFPLPFYQPTALLPFDMDNDGRQEVLMVSAADHESEISLYRNRLPLENHWIKINLVGSYSQSQGIGAQVRAYCNSKVFTKIVGINPGIYNYDNIYLYFQQDGPPDSIVVHWTTSGQKTKLTNIPMATTLSIHEPPWDYDMELVKMDTAKISFLGAEEISPRCGIKNVGTYPINSAVVNCRILRNDSLIYEDQQTIIVGNDDQVQLVQFKSYTITSHANYHLEFEVDSPADQNPYNNLRFQNINVLRFFPANDDWKLAQNLYKFVISDFNNDGKPDLIGRSSSHEFLYFINKGNQFEQVNLFSYLDKLFYPEQIPEQIVVINLNNDEFLDLICFDNRTIQFFLNQNGKYFTLDDHHRGLFSDDYKKFYIFDYNQDGYEDLILSIQNYHYAFLNQRQGEWESFYFNELNNFSMDQLRNFAALDFDSDKLIDLSILTEDFNILKMNGLGAYGLLKPQDINSVPMNYSYTFTAADFNQDGKIDIAIGDIDSLYIFQNKGIDCWEKHTIAELPLSFHLMKQIHFDHNCDGLMDLVVFGDNSRYFIYQNQGDFKFIPLGNYETFQITYNSIYDVAAGDIDNDGDEDLLICSNQNFELLQNDTNNKNYISVSLKNENNRPAYGSQVYAYLGEKILTRYLDWNPSSFGSIIFHTNGEKIDSVVIHWLNMAESKIMRPQIGQHYELIQPQWDQDLAITKISPHPPVAYPDSLFFTEMTIANTGSTPAENVDCQLTIYADSQVVFQNKQTVSRSDPNECQTVSFEPFQYSEIQPFQIHYQILKLDNLLFNNDWKTSLVTAVFKDITKQYGLELNQQDGYIKKTILVDYDQDGDVDILIVYSDYNYYNLQLLRNDGNQFVEVSNLIHSPAQAATSSEAQNCHWIDINRDGYPDIVVALNQDIAIYLNQRNGHFEQVEVSIQEKDNLFRYGISDFSAIDINHDSLLDLIIISTYRMYKPIILKNKGNFNFEESPLPIRLQYPWSPMQILDFNNDGEIDICLVDKDGNIRLYHQFNGMLVEQADYSTSNLGSHFQFFWHQFVDFNNDAFYDVISWMGDSVFVYQQIPAVIDQNNISESQPFNVAFKKTWSATCSYNHYDNPMSVVDFDNDGFQDITVMNSETQFMLYQNTGNSFKRIQDNFGLAIKNYRRVTGIIPFDYNNNGNIEFFLQFDRKYGQFYQNIFADNNWIKIKLDPQTVQETLYGTMVKVYCDTIVQTKFVQSIDYEYTLHFGVGNKSLIDSLIIKWADNTADKLFDLATNRVWEIQKGRYQHNKFKPYTFELFQSYPNPFNFSCTIEYALPKSSRVELQIFNMLGQKVQSFEFDHQLPGFYKIVWDGKNVNGMRVASGLYFYLLVAESKDQHFRKSRKMIVIK